MNLPQPQQEKLCKELKPYVFTSHNGWTVLKHPLVFQVPYEDIPLLNIQANKMYQYKTQQIQQAKHERNWSLIIWLHERPFRWKAFAKIAAHLHDQEYWNLFADVWTDSENIYERATLIRNLLKARSVESRTMMMTEKEKQVLYNLPDPITAWRGTRFARGDHRLSWTLDKDKACWFAKRFRQGTPVVWEAQIFHRDTVAYLDRRGENEIIALKSKITNIE